MTTATENLSSTLQLQNRLALTFVPAAYSKIGAYDRKLGA